MTHTDLIAGAMKIGAPDVAVAPVPVGTRCLHTGAVIDRGYKHEHGYISESTGRVMLGMLPNSKGKMVSAMWNRGSVVCLPNDFYWPMQSPDSAEKSGRVAVVQDAAAAQSAVEQGIGSGKAWGCGMLLLT